MNVKQLVLGSSDNAARLSGCILLCWRSQRWQHVQLWEVQEVRMSFETLALSSLLAVNFLAVAADSWRYRVVANHWLCSRR